MPESGQKSTRLPGQNWRAVAPTPAAAPNEFRYSIDIGSVGDIEDPVDSTRRAASLAWVSSPHHAATAHAAGLAGENLFHQRRYSDAVQQFRTAVGLAPANPLFHYRLAYSAWRANDLSLVEPHLRTAIQCNPLFAPAHEMLGQWHLYKAQYELALEHSAVALRLSPDDSDVIVSRAFVLAGHGDARSAWELIRPLMGNGSLAERLTILYLQIATRIGHEREAAVWALRHLSRSIFPPAERPQLLFALSGILDRLARYDEAFAQARAARALLHVPFDPAAHERAVSERIEFFSARRMQSLPRATHGSHRPIFILGMPRSGTSLVEQILASHPDVYGAGELEDLLRIANANGLGTAVDSSNRPLRLSASQIERRARDYLSVIDALNVSARYVTDKNPLNFLELGLAELLFPECRIIHCVRDPMDTCVSCYMTDFAAGVTFCRDQSALAGYYHQYARLMAHWKHVVSVPMLTVRYENVVGDVAGQTRQILDFLDLPWDERCLNFHANGRGVATASREQVRQPIYASSIGRWKHYRKHLAELSAGLGIA